jgi:hypothetical protein
LNWSKFGGLVADLTTSLFLVFSLAPPLALCLEEYNDLTFVLKTYQHITNLCPSPPQQNL